MYQSNLSVSTPTTPEYCGAFDTFTFPQGWSIWKQVLAYNRAIILYFINAFGQNQKAFGQEKIYWYATVQC